MPARSVSGPGPSSPKARRATMLPHREARPRTSWSPSGVSRRGAIALPPFGLARATRANFLPRCTAKRYARQSRSWPPPLPPPPAGPPPTHGRPSMRPTLLPPLLAAGLLLGAGPAARARPAHKRALADYLGPFLAKKLNDCRTCHLPDAPDRKDADDKPHNPF